MDVWRKSRDARNIKLKQPSTNNRVVQLCRYQILPRPPKENLLKKIFKRFMKKIRAKKGGKGIRPWKRGLDKEEILKLKYQQYD